MKRDDDDLYRTGQRNERGVIICGARKTSYPRDRRPCQSTAVMANGRCRKHGGATPAGVASPQFKTGRYSKVLPTALAARYFESRQDAELLELRDEIALVDARLAQLLARVESGESGAVWEKLTEAVKAYDAASERLRRLREMNAPDDEKRRAMEQVTDALREIRDLVLRGNRDYLAWSEIMQLVQQRRMLVESQRKREADLELTVKVDQMLLYTGALLEAIRNNVERFVPADNRRDFLAAVSEDVRRLVNAAGATGRA